MTNKLKDYLTLKIGLWETYHNHKENMANAGFLVQLSLFGSIIAEGLWPPTWVAKLIVLPGVGTFAVYFLLWFLIHYYTRWQLINKRVAALYFSGFDQAFLYFTTHELTKSDLEIYHGESHQTNQFKNFISKIFYIPGGFVRMDASIDGLPNFIARPIKAKFDEGSGAETLEILITYTSFLLMLLVATKIFLGS